jgi:glycosyltransferase involved in cell wall biosynthesis
VPGCKETVEENKNGFLIKEKNIEQLEETMIKFINDKNLIKKMGENSFQIACNKFDVKIINKKLLNEIKYVN